MNSFEKYQPGSLSQIVFAQPAVKQDLMDYATGVATNNIYYTVSLVRVRLLLLKR